jgi:hypothetical protein
MSPKHLRPTSTSRRVGRAVTIPAVLALTVAGISAPAFAGKPGGGSTSGTASCSANPNPVAWNTDFDLTVSGLAAGALVDVQISDAGGIENWNLQADSTGTAATTSHAYWRGTSTVKLIQGTGHKAHTVGSCSFSVV